MPGEFFPFFSRYFDFLSIQWERPRTQRFLGLVILAIYLFTLIIVEMGRQSWWPNFLPKPPYSHFYAIELAFTLILGIEVISLIFVLPDSFSRSMANQFEILTLILLRNAFKELSLLPEPVEIGMSNLMQLCQIGANGLGALLVFICLGIFRKVHSGRHLHIKPELVNNYIMSKKLLACVLLVIFVTIGIRDIIIDLNGGLHAPFFETIYTVLIFADIAMVLIAQRYMPCYYAVFRNSGFVVGTLLMRLSLSAPSLLSSAIAVSAALFVIALAYGVTLFGPDSSNDNQ